VVVHIARGRNTLRSTLQKVPQFHALR
jgi:hypothetical protein